MTMTIGTKIRELRKRDSRTQEALAEALGITPQAISRWEAGGSYPDVELIPAIANFFHVSIDELFGYNDDREQKIQNIIEEADKVLKSTGFTLSIGSLSQKFCDGAERLRAAADEFPNEPRILVRLGDALHKLGWHEYGGKAKIEDGTIVDDTEYNRKNLRWQEAVRVYERLLKSNPSPKEREAAVFSMVRIYSRMGEYEKAQEIANAQSPLGNCREMILPITAAGKERARYQGESIAVLLQWLDLSIEESIWMDTAISDSEYAKQVLLAVANMYEIIFSDGRCGFWHWNVSQLYLRLAKYEAKQGSMAKALEYFDKAFEHVKAYRAFIADPDYAYTAPLVAGIKPEHTPAAPVSEDYWRWEIERAPAALQEELRKNEKYAECFA